MKQNTLATTVLAMWDEERAPHGLLHDLIRVGVPDTHWGDDRITKLVECNPFQTEENIIFRSLHLGNSELNFELGRLPHFFQKSRFGVTVLWITRVYIPQAAVLFERWFAWTHVCRKRQLLRQAKGLLPAQFRVIIRLALTCPIFVNPLPSVLIEIHVHIMPPTRGGTNDPTHEVVSGLVTEFLEMLGDGEAH